MMKDGSTLKPELIVCLHVSRMSIYYIFDNGTVTTDSLVEEFGITHRTVQRDLNVLEYNELIMSRSR